MSDIADDRLAVGETAHQAGDDTRADVFVRAAMQTYRGLIGRRDPENDDLAGEIDRGLIQARSDLAGRGTGRVAFR